MPSHDPRFASAAERERHGHERHYDVPQQHSRPLRVMTPARPASALSTSSHLDQYMQQHRELPERPASAMFEANAQSSSTLKPKAIRGGLFEAGAGQQKGSTMSMMREQQVKEREPRQQQHTQQSRERMPHQQQQAREPAVRDNVRESQPYPIYHTTHNSAHSHRNYSKETERQTSSPVRSRYEPTSDSKMIPANSSHSDRHAQPLSYHPREMPMQKQSDAPVQRKAAQQQPVLMEYEPDPIANGTSVSPHLPDHIIAKYPLWREFVADMAVEQEVARFVANELRCEIREKLLVETTDELDDKVTLCPGFLSRSPLLRNVLRSRLEACAHCFINVR